MNIFHYHYWTNLVEETEDFYIQNGFRVAGRFAITNDGMKPYHPPLSWDDFGNENPQFRIIEMRKGKVNVTFGAGKKPMFDHIGFLVTKKEYDEISKRAVQLGWKINSNEKRTFIGTPFHLRIELQQRRDVVEDENARIVSMDISVKNLAAKMEISKLLGKNTSGLHFMEGDHLALKKIIMSGEQNKLITDPNGVIIEIVDSIP